MTSALKAPVVFDLDGTLIDSLPDIVAATNKMLADYDAPPLPDTTIRGFVGKGLPNLVDQVKIAAGLQKAGGAMDKVIGHYNAAPTALTTLYPGVLDALNTLKASGHPMGICTNKEYELTLPVLTSTGLDPFFDVVIGGNSRPTRKPDPEPLLHAFKTLGAAGGIFIGDSEVDAETAERAQMPCGLYTKGYRKTPIDQIPHSFSFNHFADLPGLIAGST